MTTSGASVLTDFAAVDRSMMIWRQFSQWVGGMGIVVLALAVLPRLRVGGRQLMEHETPGPDLETLTTSIRDTARRLWILYVSLTVVLSLILAVLGWTGVDERMGLYEAVAYAFSTLPTGGFGTDPRSVEPFAAASQWVIALFMVIGGVNFALLYRAFVRRHPATIFRDNELRLYLSLLLAASASTWASSSPGRCSSWWTRTASSSSSRRSRPSRPRRPRSETWALVGLRRPDGLVHPLSDVSKGIMIVLAMLAALFLRQRIAREEPAGDDHPAERVSEARDVPAPVWHADRLAAGGAARRCRRAGGHRHAAAAPRPRAALLRRLRVSPSPGSRSTTRGDRARVHRGADRAEGDPRVDDRSGAAGADAARRHGGLAQPVAAARAQDYKLGGTDEERRYPAL